jgi:hypothetical protein
MISEIFIIIKALKMKRTGCTLNFKYFFLIPGFYLGLVSLQAQTMQIGTNFWARVDWTGEFPFKSDANFSRALNSGISNYLMNENVWNEEFCKEIDFYTVLRFMDWLPTNKSPITNWSQRRFPNDADQSAPFGGQVGVAYEWMIDLCNRVEADIWLCIPHAANDDYCKKLAELLFTNMNPKFKIYVEYSNEVWNFQEQGNYAQSQGTQIGITKQKYVAHRSAQIWQIFKDVFGNDFQSRVVKTLCGQATNSWIANEQLAYIYGAKNPTGLRPDVYGIAPYFGGNGFDANVPNVWQLLNTDIFEHRWDSPTKASRIEGIKNNYQQIKTFDEKIKLVAYEGGQHIQLNATKVNFDPKMYDLYMKYLNAIDDYLSLFTHYVNAGVCADGNCWGAKEYTGQNMQFAPKYRALFDYAMSKSTGNNIQINSENEIKVYPNPFDSELTIKSGANAICEVALFTSTGSKLLTKKADAALQCFVLSTAGFDEGLYLLQIKTANDLILRKVLLKHKVQLQ